MLFKFSFVYGVLCSNFSLNVCFHLIVWQLSFFFLHALNITNIKFFFKEVDFAWNIDIKKQNHVIFITCMFYLIACKDKYIVYRMPEGDDFPGTFLYRRRALRSVWPPSWGSSRTVSQRMKVILFKFLKNLFSSKAVVYNLIY